VGVSTCHQRGYFLNPHKFLKKYMFWNWKCTSRQHVSNLPFTYAFTILFLQKHFLPKYILFFFVNTKIILLTIYIWLCFIFIYSLIQVIRVVPNGCCHAENRCCYHMNLRKNMLSCCHV
jgi:hypothetical protein